MTGVYSRETGDKGTDSGGRYACAIGALGYVVERMR